MRSKRPVIGLCGICGGDLATIRWSARYQGLIGVRPDGSTCCSLYETEYPAREGAALALERELETARRRLRALQTRAHTGTRATMPCHHWVSAVHSGAIALGAPPFTLEPADRELVRRWFDAGEPVWMAAEGLRIVVCDRLRAKAS